MLLPSYCSTALKSHRRVEELGEQGKMLVLAKRAQLHYRGTEAT